MTYPGSDAVNALLLSLEGSSLPTSSPSTLFKYSQFGNELQSPNIDLLNYQNAYLQALVSIFRDESLDLHHLSRDAIGFAMLAWEDDMLEGVSESVIDSLQQIAFSCCTDSHDDELYRSSQECLFRGRRRTSFGSHRWLDSARATYSIEPSSKAKISTTCDGKLVIIGCQNGIPSMTGLDLATILSILRWGLERAPFINGDPTRDMVGNNKVQGQTVISFLFAGHIGARGTSWLLSQIIYGDLNISKKRKNCLAREVSRYRGNSSDGQGYLINSVTHPRMLNRTNLVVLDDDPYIVFGEYLVAKLTKRKGYYRLDRFREPQGRLTAVGRTSINRPLK
ncbi:unnamed protein product [Agarophyton chilense]